MASSRGDNKDTYCSMHLETALNEPMYDLTDGQVLSG